MSNAISIQPPSHGQKESWFPATAEEREAVAGQLERILASPGFKTSQRTSHLLAYIVEHTLEGRSEELKERLLGVEVFGRKPDYDTGADHIVRSAAGEIRKRLAQYYQEPGRDREIRIDLLPGSYVPQFRPPEKKVSDIGLPDIGLPVDENISGFVPAANRPSLRLTPVRVATVSVVLLGLIAWGLFRLFFGPSALDRFWGPFLASGGPVALCVGDPGTAWEGSESNAFRGISLPRSSPTPQPNRPNFWFRRSLPLGDAVTVARLFALLHEKGRDERIVYGPDSTLSDLRQDSALLIGGIDNFWTMNLTRELRYRFQLDAAAKTIFIEDSYAPSRRDWQVELDLPLVSMKVDYAIVAKLIHPTTGRPVIIAGGIRDAGTLAAGEFLTSAAYLGELERRAPAHWSGVEAVISTKVFKGTPGPPQLLAAYFW